MEKKDIHFRFEDLEIWSDSIDLMKELFEIITQLDLSRNFRIANQLEGAALSISNNIAEGSGSRSGADFKRYLGYSRSSVFECANIIYVIFKDDKMIAT